jgi:hypothetical protein
MKSKLTLLFLALTTSFALAHGGVEIGPNGGRILEFSKNESMHGEVTVKEGKMHIALLDKDLKPVTVADQTLTITTGSGAKPQKVEVEKTATGFAIPAVKEGSLLVFQFRETEKAKPVTARFTYDTSNCDACDSPEWICKCEMKKKEAAKKK